MASIPRGIAAALLVFACAILAPPVFAQSADQALDRETAIAIKGLEAERENLLVQIRKCEKTIANSNAIISAARAKGNTSATEIATKAAVTAEEAKRKYEHSLRMIESTLASWKRVDEPLSEKEKRRARERLAQLRVEISKLQGMLRSCIEETTKSFAERQTLENEIDFWYDAAVETAKNDLLFECGASGLGQLASSQEESCLTPIRSATWSKRLRTSTRIHSLRRNTGDDCRQSAIKRVPDYNERLIEQSWQPKDGL